MSAFDLESSIVRARARLEYSSPRAGRRDRGSSRLDPDVEHELGRLLNTQQRPEMRQVERSIRAFAQSRALKPPARATLYNALARVPLPDYRWEELPPPVRQCLYNLRSEDPAATALDRVPGDQLVFYAFNYGPPRALSFASGCPWLCLWRAARRPGWRPKSKALLQAVMSYRDI